jgi:8-oxo-dGTP pyrophosphatase MutT (NUDIX family)
MVPMTSAPIPCDAPLREALVRRLAAHERRSEPLDGRRHAAVAVVIVDSDPERDGHDPLRPEQIDMSMLPGDAAGLSGTMDGVAGGAAFVLCRRGSKLRAHARQWALPGGRIDQGESVIDAALRETHEEVGLSLDETCVVGMLDDYVTRSGYVMTPVVLWAGPGAVLAPNPDEVEYAYRIGLHELLRTDSPRFLTIPESDRPVVQVLLGQDAIHAPTGAVLVQFRWVGLEGRCGDDARVGHFEQPVFAWR